MQTYHGREYAEAGITETFVQDNFSHSLKGILRGMHYQLKRPQAKLISVVMAISSYLLRLVYPDSAISRK